MFILFFCRLCNSCSNCILRAYVLVLYIFTNVSQACLGDFSSWICKIMESDTHRKPIQDFPSFLMPSFIHLDLLLCGVFWEKRFFLITSYEILITFPHQKIHNPKFSKLQNFFWSNFLIAIWKKSSATSQSNTQCLLGVSQMICSSTLDLKFPIVD